MTSEGTPAGGVVSLGDGPGWQVGTQKEEEIYGCDRPYDFSITMLQDKTPALTAGGTTTTKVRCGPSLRLPRNLGRNDFIEISPS